MRRLEGKVAIITGSGSGIGRATALLFAEEGAKVVVVDIDPKGGEETVRKIKEKNGEASFVQTNVMKYEEVKLLIDRVILEYGKIDVLHNNAGGWVKGFSDTVIDDQESEWNRMIDLNLKSLYYTSKEVVPHMMKAKKGSIINTCYDECDRGDSGNAGV